MAALSLTGPQTFADIFCGWDRYTLAPSGQWKAGIGKLRAKDADQPIPKNDPCVKQ